MEKTLNQDLDRKWGLKEAVFLSFFLHFLGLFYVVDFSSMLESSDKIADKDEPIRIRLMPASKKEKQRPKQIVNSVKSKNQEKPKDAKFLGEFSQTVDRQTTASTVGSFKNAGVGVRNGILDAQNKAKAAKKTKKKKVTKVDPKKLKFSDLTFTKPDLHKAINAPALGLKNASKKSKGLSQNNDFIEDIPLGDMTALNTVETKYYGFYNRIRQRLEQYWGNTLNEKVVYLFKSGRSIASDTNHLTALQIHLDSEGNIIEITLKTTSGIQELDEAAIESFSKAGPFPNPPTGMIKNGVATLEWGFVVKG